MPASALDCLSALRIHYPMMFSIQNIYDDSGGRTSHCGVLEFTAEEGSIFAPQWMMDSLKILEGDLVLLKSVYLPKGTFVKLQPHTTDFINLSNPKAVLEKTLQRYACLTTGDTITISHDKKKFQIDVLEAEPSPAISIIDTDCEVDFAAPLDYKEPEKKASQKAEEEKPKFVAFSGLARRVDGAPLAHMSDMVAEKLEKNVISKKNSTKTCDCEGPGKKMVFGSNTINEETPNKYDVKKEETTEETAIAAAAVLADYLTRLALEMVMVMIGIGLICNKANVGSMRMTRLCPKQAEEWHGHILEPPSIIQQSQFCNQECSEDMAGFSLTCD
nr:ubiquitin recognition factor in ER-associated degradation protein 1-like [Coffea arabica]XP_027083871.1 ubiquitin recognition factor in ER-associated degradation protein 1-like [Coffea arabica]